MMDFKAFTTVEKADGPKPSVVRFFLVRAIEEHTVALLIFVAMVIFFVGFLLASRFIPGGQASTACLEFTKLTLGAFVGNLVPRTFNKSTGTDSQ